MYSLYSIRTAAHYFLILKPPLSYNRKFNYNLIRWHTLSYMKMPPALRTWAICYFHENNKIMLSSILHSINQAYKLLTLFVFHYKLYITDRGGITSRHLNLTKWTQTCIARCRYYRTASSFQIWWPGPDTGMKDATKTVELLAQAVKPSAPAIRTTSVLVLLLSPGEEGRGKVLTTTKWPHFHRTVTSPPPSLPKFREIQM